MRTRRRLMVLGALVLGLGVMSPAAPASAAFPGDDGRIAFTRANQIYTVKADGSGLRRLTTSGKNYRPEYSPTGARIAYLHENAAGGRDVWVMRADGKTKKRVTRTGTVAATPSWSPDGTWIAFAGPRAGGEPVLQKVRSMAPYDSKRLRGYVDGDPLDEHSMSVDWSLAWSPDGRRIAFYSHDWPDSPDNYLLVYDIASKAVRAQDMVGGACCGFGYFADLTWSASGDKMAYTDGTYDEYEHDTQPPPVVTVRTYPDWDDVRHTTRRGDRQPVFSPSGKRFAVMNASSGKARIYVSRANGTQRHFLVNGGQPDWQPRP